MADPSDDVSEDEALSLVADLELNRGDFHLRTEVELPGRGVSAVFGPSGSGKSTLLRCLAGLEPAALGRVRMGHELWQDSGAGRFVPPHRRSVGYVFQEADLFGHLDVAGNLDYAERRGSRDRITRADVVRWLDIGALLGRETQGLSGGERQRVAIARALMANPRLLLLDEPLSSLDEVSRLEILPYLESLPTRLDVPIVYVSHSLSEVLRLADHMVWLVDGGVRRSGRPAEVVRDAGFAVWQGDEAGVVVSAVLESQDDRHRLSRFVGPWGSIRTLLHPGAPGARVRLRIRARDVSLALDPEPRSSILNEFELRVERVTADRGEVLVELGADHTEATLLSRVTSLSVERLGLEPGRRVFARVKSVAVLD